MMKKKAEIMTKISELTALIDASNVELEAILCDKNANPMNDDIKSLNVRIERLMIKKIMLEWVLS